MALITYPDKSPGDQFFSTEANEVKDVVNTNVADALSKTGVADQSVVSNVEFQNKVSIGVATFLNSLDVAGGMAVGSGYAGISTAPADGLLVEGTLGIGVDNPNTKITLRDAGNSGTIVRILEPDNASNTAIAISAFNTGGVLNLYRSNGIRTVISAIGDSYFNFGNVAVGKTSALAKVDAHQGSETDAIPALRLTQLDLSEEIIKLDATIGVGNPIEAKAAKTLTGTHFVKWNIEGVGDVYLEVGTIA